MDDKLQKAIDLQKKLQEESAQKRSEEYQNFVRENIKKDIMTLTVGVISLIEDYFGGIWGIGKNYSELSTNEVAWREDWKELRDEIFNRLNNKLRKIDKTFNTITITQKQYHMVIRSRRKNDE